MCLESGDCAADSTAKRDTRTISYFTHFTYFTLLTCKVDCAADSTAKRDTRPPKTAGIPKKKNQRAAMMKKNMRPPKTAGMHNKKKNHR